MKFYKVYKKSKTLPEECIMVKAGFYWENFFFGIFWALYKKIWDLVLIYLLFISIVKALMMFYPMFVMQIMTGAIALQVMLSFYASALLELKLTCNGYKKIDLVAGATKEEALLRFLSNSKKS